jgi:hypothetical protein
MIESWFRSGHLHIYALNFNLATGIPNINPMNITLCNIWFLKAFQFFSMIGLVHVNPLLSKLCSLEWENSLTINLVCLDSTTR